MNLKLDNFKGMYPMIAPHLIPNNAAQEAVNALFNSGRLEPLRDGLAVVADIRSASDTIFLYRADSAEHWLSWVGQHADVVASNAPNDSTHRLYWTTTANDGYPQTSDYTLIVAGTYHPDSSRRLGVPKPTSPITCAAVDGYPGDGNGKETAYVYTLVTNAGEESMPSAMSNIGVFSGGQRRKLTGMSFTLASAWSGIDLKGAKIYRTNTGSTGTDYQQVYPIKSTAVAYADGIVPITADLSDVYDQCLDAELGPLLRSTSWLPPPQNMKGLVAHPAGYMLGFVGNSVSVSVPYMPHAWPYDYSFVNEVVGLAVFGQTTLVLTKGMPYTLTGTDPASLTQERLETGFACISKRSIVDMGEKIVYASPYGLVGVGTDGVDLLTKLHLNKRTFSELLPADPANLHACYHDQKYIAFNGNGGFIFDLATNELSKHSINARCTYTIDATSRLFYVGIDNLLYEWDSGTPLLLSWKSKSFFFGEYENFALARISADDTATVMVTARVGQADHTYTCEASGDIAFPLPGNFTSDRYQVEVSCRGGISRIEVAGDAQELVSGAS